MIRNLKTLRESLSMTQKEFATSLGISLSTYNGYEIGAREPKSDFLISVARKYGVTIDYLMGYSSTPLDTSQEEFFSTRYSQKALTIAKKYDELDRHGQGLLDAVLSLEHSRCISSNSQNVIEFPSIRRPEWTVYDQQVSAGNGISLWEESATKYYIPESGADCVRYADFGIRVSGDSMEPRFHDGDILMIQKTETLELGEIGVVIMDGEGYVKQIGPGQLISLNPRYAPIPITDNVCITGRVTGVLPYTLDELDPVPSDD